MSFSAVKLRIFKRQIFDICSVVLKDYFKSAFRMNGMDAKQPTSVHGRSNLIIAIIQLSNRGYSCSSKGNEPI